MIVNTQDTVQSLLDRSEFHFYLTGGRFFKTESPISDCDYFVQDSREVRSFLGNEGFRGLEWDYEEMQNQDYKDHQTVVVLASEDCGTHIQLVENAAIKEKAQELLLAFPELVKALEVLKDRRSFLWNRLYDYVSNNKEGKRWY